MALPHKRIPRFYGFRIYFSAAVLYYGLILPFLLILTIKHAPDLKKYADLKSQEVESYEENRFVNNSDDQALISLSDSLLISGSSEIEEDTIGETKINVGPVAVTINDPKTQGGNIDSNQIGRAFNVIFNLLLLSFLLGFIFNLPFKRYLSRKRKNKDISARLYRFCKRFILRTPTINVAILGLAFIIGHIFMFIVMQTESSFANEIEEKIYVNFFYISLVASILSLMFVYYWEKHRVHIKYIEHIFGKDELKRRIFNIRVGRIRNRMVISAVMTTLLPLTIVLIYLLLSVTYVNDLNIEEYSEDQKNILFGDFGNYTDIFTDDTDGFQVPGWMYYINAINSISMFIGIYSSVFIAFIYIVFIVKWSTQDIVFPVKELLASMKETGKGEMDNYTIVRTNDELGELSEGYNDMTQRLGDYIENISRMTEAYSRFVPKQFLEYLDKESFIDIKLGDQVQKEMTVLFTDIRSFTEISEQMTPKENFDFINYYLGYMEPVIRNNNGFIDKFIGDSIMALFSDNAEEAINASIEMRIKLSQFNQVMDQFGKPTINSGIGIHSGSLMLGIIGGEGRMDGTVISDAVNLASRLEGLTKIYGSSIIISQDTLIKLNNPAQYNYRFLDIVKVKGKKEAVYIFEIIDGDSEDIKQLKLKTNKDFATGIDLYKSRKFNEALKTFKKVYDLNNHDMAASVYIERCKNFIKFGVPDDWDGIEMIKWK